MKQHISAAGFVGCVPTDAPTSEKTGWDDKCQIRTGCTNWSRMGMNFLQTGTIKYGMDAFRALQVLFPAQTGSCCKSTASGFFVPARHVALRCLLNLKDFLVSSNHEYSPDAALRWFDQSDFKNKGALVTHHRLSDLYQYGTVQPIHAFPVALPYYQGLLEVWKTILDDYLATLPLKQSAISQIRRCISRFFYRTQERGIQCPSEISFVHLETYYQDEAHTTHNETARYTYNVSDILLYMVEKGMCQHGLAWYLFFRMQGRILHLNSAESAGVH